MAETSNLLSGWYGRATGGAGGMTAINPRILQDPGIKQRLEMAQALRKGAINTSPVASPWEAAARLGTAALGSYAQNAAMGDATAASDAYAKGLGSILKAMNSPQPDGAMIGAGDGEMPAMGDGAGGAGSAPNAGRFLGAQAAIQSIENPAARSLLGQDFTAKMIGDLLKAPKQELRTIYDTKTGRDVVALVNFDNGTHRVVGGVKQPDVGEGRQFFNGQIATLPGYDAARATTEQQIAAGRGRGELINAEQIAAAKAGGEARGQLPYAGDLAAAKAAGTAGVELQNARALAQARAGGTGAGQLETAGDLAAANATGTMRGNLAPVQTPSGMQPGAQALAEARQTGELQAQLVPVAGPDGVDGPTVPIAKAVHDAKEGGKPTGEENIAAGYADRMKASEALMKNLVAGGFTPGKMWETARSKIPGAGNYMVSPEFQQFKQAQEDWVRAKLRKESGAVIGDQEMASEIKLYFPQPGDGPQAVAQKEAARAIATDAMIRSAGKLYAPPPPRTNGGAASIKQRYGLE